MKQTTERQVYSPPEIAVYLGISQSGAYNLFNSEDFPSFRIGGRWMVTKQAFEKWLAEQQEVKGDCR